MDKKKQTTNKNNTKSGNKKDNVKRKDITKTEKWNEADWEYSRIVAESMLPPIITSTIGRIYNTEEERIKLMKDILNICPEYYPAMLEIGKYYIKVGRTDESKKYLNDTLKILEEYFPKKEYRKVLKYICDALENMFEYEIAIDYYNKWANYEDDKNEIAYIYNSLGICYNMIGEIDKGIALIKKSIDLKKCAEYYSDLGWVYIINGDTKSAKEALNLALKINKNYDIAKRNMEVCEWLIKNNKGLNDYLLRENCDDDPDDCNSDRLRAFKMYLLKNENYKNYEKSNIFTTLRIFLNFVSKISSDVFVYDDIEKIEMNFEIIMDKFIFKMGDIDEEIFEDVYKSVLEFYKFTKENKLSSDEEYASLKKTMMDLKEKLKEKMLKYNKVRHNMNYTEEEKEKIRNELFGDNIDPFFTI